MNKVRYLLATILTMNCLASHFATAEQPEGGSPQRSSMQQHEPIVWDLTLLYATEEDWQADRLRFDRSPAEFQAFRGRLGEGAPVLADALETVFGTFRDFWRFSTYASLLRSENARDAANVERSQLVSMIATNMWSARSFLEPELLALGEATIADFLATEPRLEIFRFYLENLIRRQPHTLGAEAEQVLSLLSPISGAPQSVFSLLTNSDMRWPVVTLSDGTEAELTQPGYARFRAVDNRDDRELVFRTYWGFLRNYESTLGNTYFHNVQGAVLNARARNHPTALSQRFFRENLPVEVYTQLLDQVHAGLPLMHRYLELRRKVMGVETLYYHDIYNSLVEKEMDFDFATAADLTLRSAAPLGAEYVAKLAAGLAGPYTHVYPQPGKAPGAFMSGAVVDAIPIF
ncbi:MAG: M3 family metallopeptidase [Verrucomicrobia bacterium]|nr:M3 family metallopeptidase [Verrucomicrobiota bacterium]